MKTIKLYGHLGKIFGKIHRLDVSDSLDAIRALSANYPKFQHEFAKLKRKYMVAVNNNLVSTKDELLLPAHEISFIPVVSGSGNGIAHIIEGAALIVAAIYAPTILAEVGITLSTTAATVIGTSLASFGVAMVLGGISQLLTKNQDPQQDSRNYGFSGPVNNTGVGNPVPVLYGRMIIGSQVISASMQSADIPIADSAVVTTNSINFKGQY